MRLREIPHDDVVVRRHLKNSQSRHILGALGEIQSLLEWVPVILEQAVMDESVNIFDRKMTLIFRNRSNLNISFSLNAQSGTSCDYWPQSSFNIIAPTCENACWIKVFVVNLIVYDLFLDEELELILG